jgi:hypothetical protein
MYLDLAPTVRRQAYTRFSPTRTPPDHRRFDAPTRSYALPNAVIPSTQEWNEVRTDVILAQQFKGLIRRRYTFMTEGIDALLPCCHNRHHTIDYVATDQSGLTATSTRTVIIEPAAEPSVIPTTAASSTATTTAS